MRAWATNLAEAEMKRAGRFRGTAGACDSIIKTARSARRLLLNQRANVPPVFPLPKEHGRRMRGGDVVIVRAASVNFRRIDIRASWNWLCISKGAERKRGHEKYYTHFIFWKQITQLLCQRTAAA